MKNVGEIKEKLISRVTLLSLQSIRAETVPDVCDLLSDIRSDMENDATDANEKYLFRGYNFEEDIEKLIEVSKKFQADYENEQDKSDAVSDDNCLNIPILSSNSQSRDKASASKLIPPVNDRDNFYFSDRSSRKENISNSQSIRSNKQFTPTIPHLGPFGTGIIRASPKKHSCVKNRETTKRSHRFGLNVKPYTSRYYNFDRTHPNLKLVESGLSMIPKRISKETAKVTATSSISVKPLLTRGLTWHEFFERCNVYSATSFQSSHISTHSTAIQPTVSEQLAPKSSDNTKIQKCILPQLNIKAECRVQRIPEISIAPCIFKRTVNTNIKLVEIMYEESDSNVETVEEQREEFLEKPEDKPAEPQSEQCASDLPSENLEPLNINDRISETNTSLTSSSMTPSKSNGYDSSLEDSVSLNASQASAAISGLRGHEMKPKPVRDVGIQTQKFRNTSIQRKKDAPGRTISSSSDHNKVEHDGSLFQSQEESQEIKLPTFPANELVQMVDEIFDTSSDVANMTYKYVLKETSVQTDIVWENINDLFREQIKPNPELPTETVENKVPESCPHSNTNFVDQIAIIETTLPPPSNIANENEEFDNQQHLLQVMRPAGERCRHSRLKKIKICSCLGCKSNIRFSSINIDQSIQRTSNESSSSPVFHPGPVRPSAKVNLFPSERYKRMKQAQRAHFENDPRISRTLRKIYATAAKNDLRKETSSSSASDHYRQVNGRACEFSPYNDEVLEPDLFTFSDEVLLFGLHSHDEIQYSSSLLKTESSQDTSVSIGKYYATDDLTNRLLGGHKLFCTNSEESSSSSINGQRVSQLEQFLLKDIENSGSDPSALSSLLSASSLERKMKEIQLKERGDVGHLS